MERTFRIEIARCEQIVPKPILRDITWPPTRGAAEQVLHHLEVNNRIAGTRELAEVIKRAKAESPSSQGATPPAQHALVCALLGMEEHPWSKREEPEPEITII